MVASNHAAAELISLIVPIYNTDRYLDECLQSICRQSYSQFECFKTHDCLNILALLLFYPQDNDLGRMVERGRADCIMTHVIRIGTDEVLRNRNRFFDGKIAILA